MMRAIHLITACAILVAGAPSKAGKPPSGGASNPQIAYENANGKSNQLVVANEDGSGTSVVYTMADQFRFDLSGRASGKVAISRNSVTDPSILLLTLQLNSTGGLVAAGPPVRLRDARRNTNVDFSPDGTKVAFACCQNGETEQLVVYDLTTGSSTTWAVTPFVWDLAWFRGGSSIAFASGAPSGPGQVLYEVTAPNADGVSAPAELLRDRGEFYLDASRGNPDALVLNYHDANGNALSGLWQAPTAGDPTGHFLETDLVHDRYSFFTETGCEDRKVAYKGPPDKTPTWYIRDRQTGSTALLTRSSSVGWVQFWPDPVCP